jgi:hypothetical protein
MITGAAAITVVAFAGFTMRCPATPRQIGFGPTFVTLHGATVAPVLLLPAGTRLLGDWKRYLRLQLAADRSSLA